MGHFARTNCFDCSSHMWRGRCSFDGWYLLWIFKNCKYFKKLITLAKVSNWNSVQSNQSYSEPFRNIFPIHSESSEPIRKTFCISIDEKRSKINPTSSDSIRGINPNQVFHPKDFELWFIQTEFSIRIDLDKFEGGMIQSNSDKKFDLDLFEFGLVRISSDWVRLSRIDFWPFFINRDTKRFSEWFGSTFRNSTDSIRMTFNLILSPGEDNVILNLSLLKMFLIYRERNCGKLTCQECPWI